MLTYDAGNVQYFVKWLTPSDANVTNDGDTLIFHPTTSNSLKASLRIYFATKEGMTEIKKNGIKITIPKKDVVFPARNDGKYLTGNNVLCNIGSFSSDYFSYSTVGNNYVFTNKKDINIQTSTYIDIDYTCTAGTITAGGYIDENGDYQRLNDNNLNTLPVSISINNNVLYDDPLYLEIHTKVDTQDIMKTRSTVIYEWQSAWDRDAKVEKPIDLENYFFIRWDLSSKVPATSSQVYSIIWSEDTVHDGTVVYTSGPVVTDNSEVQRYNNTFWSNERSLGSSPDAYVITMHRRDEARMNGNWATVSNEVILNVNWRTSNNQQNLPYIQQYRKSVESTAYVAPDEGEGPRDFTKRVRNYKDEGSHYVNGGQELIQGEDMDELNTKLIYNFTFTEKKCMDESKLTWNPNTKIYTAPERTLTLIDGERGQNDVRISPKKGGQWNKWGADEEKALRDTDYFFDALTFTITEYDVIRLDDDTWSNPFEHTNHNEYGYTDIYVRYEGEAEYKFHKTVKITASSTEIALPDKVVGFKVVHKSTFAATDMLVTTKLKLRATENLMDIITNDIALDRDTVIKNKARFSETMTGVTPFTVDTEHYTVAQRDAFESSYILTVTDSKIFSKKSMATGANIEENGEQGTVTVPTVISGWGYNNSGYKKRLKKCVFRDLLPVDFSVDTDTIFIVPIESNYDSNALVYPSTAQDPPVYYSVSGNNYNNIYRDASTVNSETHRSKLFPESSYSVTFEENKNNTGRTMMVITVTVPDYVTATGVSVFYKMKATQSSIAANTTTPVNYVSFKDLTENQSIPVDKVENIGLITDNKLVGCYSSYDDLFTAYASATTTLQKPPASTTAMSSVITAEGSTLTKHEHVGLNRPYGYLISYSNDLNVQTKNLVFYDVLERPLEGPLSQWEGTLTSVDVSSIAEIANANDANATCKPVVYYVVSAVEEGSTQIPKAKDQFTVNDFTLELEGGAPNLIWSTTPPADLSKVTAIAVDCRKDTSGNDFVLDRSQYMGFTIHMHSPMGGDDRSITFNEAHLLGNFASVQGAAPLDMVTSNDVTLHCPNPTFTKSAVPASGTEENPNKVVMGSTLEYKLTITNPDEMLAMYNVVIEDAFTATQVELKHNNMMIQIGDEEPVPLNGSPHVFNTKTTDQVIDGVSKKVFTTTIASIGAGKTVQLIIPVTVTATEGQVITNTATVKRVNDATGFVPVDSETTYHVASSVVAKILKVNEKGDPIGNAKLQIVDSEDQPVTLREDGVTLADDFFLSGSLARSFDIVPNKQYKLVELETPGEDYKPTDPITFKVDQEGFHHIGSDIVEQIEMTDENAYNIYFHTAVPGQDDEIFDYYGPADIRDNGFKIDSLSGAPVDPSGEYVFVGWYHNSGYTQTDDPATNATAEVDFENDSYPRTSEENPDDYHLYAKWEKVTALEYKVIFHENKPGGSDEEIQKEFRVYESTDLVEEKIAHFYDIPAWAGDEYVFAGWYHNSGYAQTEAPDNSANADSYVNTASIFEDDTYPPRNGDYHLYAKWIPVGTVTKAEKDTNIVSGYRGFGLAGVQIRQPEMYDDNYTVVTPGGMRFVTSLSESLLSQIDALSTQKVVTNEGNVDVEYGYAVGSEANIDIFLKHYNLYSNPDTRSGYKLLYKGENVNGVNTTVSGQAATDYRYIVNVNCTKGTGMIQKDHRNYDDYRLYTMVVTYEGDSSTRTGEMVDARSYLRYYDANGKLRVFFNNYKADDPGAGKYYYGGCMCSYDQVSSMAIPSSTTPTT